MPNTNDRIIWTRPWSDDHRGLRVVHLDGVHDPEASLLVERDDRDSQGDAAWTETEDAADRAEAIALALLDAEPLPASMAEILKNRESQLAEALGASNVEPMGWAGLIAHARKKAADLDEVETRTVNRTRAEVLRKFEIACGYDSTCTSIEAAIDDVCSTVEAQRGQARPLGSDEHTLRIAYLLGCERVPMSELGANVVGVLEHMAKELNAQHGEPIQDALERETNAIHRTRAEVLRKFEIACGYSSTCTNIEAAIDDVCAVVSSAFGEQSDAANEAKMRMQVANVLGLIGVHPDDEDVSPPTWDTLIAHAKALHQSRPFSPEHTLRHAWRDPAIEKLAARVEKLEGWRERLSSRPNGADVLVSLDKRTDERDWLVKRVEERLDALEKLAQGTAGALDTHKTLAHERLDELEAAWGRAPLREWVESKFDMLERRVDEDRVSQVEFDDFEAAVETWQAAHAQTVANLAKNVASIDLAFGGLAAAMTTGRDAVSDWQKKVDETVRQFGEAGNLLRGDVAALAQKVDGIASNANKALVGLAQSNAETTNNRFVELAKRIDTLEANSWHRVGDGAFGPPFGTLRVCTECGSIVAGGPTRCVRCATDGELIAELGTKTDAIVRRADSGAEALVQLGVLVSELRAKIDRIDERTRTSLAEVRGKQVPRPGSRWIALERALANFESTTKAGT